MENLIHELLASGETVLFWALSAAALWVARWVTARIKSEYLAQSLVEFQEVALLVVKDVYKSWVKPRQRDGKWTDQNKKEAKRKAVTQLKSYLGPKGLELLMKILNGKPDNIEKALGALVEDAIDRSKLAALPLRKSTAG